MWGGSWCQTKQGSFWLIDFSQGVTEKANFFILENQRAQKNCLMSVPYPVPRNQKKRFVHGAQSEGILSCVTFLAPTNKKKKMLAFCFPLPLGRRDEIWIFSLPRSSSQRLFPFHNCLPSYHLGFAGGTWDEMLKLWNYSDRNPLFYFILFY